MSGLKRKKKNKSKKRIIGGDEFSDKDKNSLSSNIKSNEKEFESKMSDCYNKCKKDCNEKFKKEENNDNDKNKDKDSCHWIANMFGFCPSNKDTSESLKKKIK